MYNNMDAIKQELSNKVMELAPRVVGSNSKVGERNTVFVAVITGACS